MAGGKRVFPDRDSIRSGEPDEDRNMIAQALSTLVFDQVHLGVPNPLLAAEWYRHYLGATSGDHEDRVMVGGVRFIFLRNTAAQRSHGAVIDHVGLSTHDLVASMQALADSGAHVVEAMRKSDDLHMTAVIEDPWGATIELIENGETLGLDHVHVVVPEPSVTSRWYADMFGAEVDSSQGRIGGVKLGGVRILTDIGVAAPSAG